MQLEKIKTPGLAHLSWFLASGGQAVVIDPRRDIGVYLKLARENEVVITHILETHRNEDLISGAPLLAAATGARVLHGPDPDAPIQYAETCREGDRIDLGSLRVEVLETPGHTNDSVSFVVYDQDHANGAVAVFTGDALFVGDVGRTDFYPDRAREVAGDLYDSLQKLLALGDQVVICPAHGAGSVCGSGMASRELSTLGHERLNNPRLQLSRDAFIDAKVSENHERPPYFREMERLNAEGCTAFDPHAPPPLDSGDLDPQQAQLVDVRGVSDFCGAHVPGSLCIPEGMLASFAGWFLHHDRPIQLITRDVAQAERAVRTLGRIGFDHVVGHHTGIVPFATSGRAFETLQVVDTDDVARLIEADEPGTHLLDVRSIDEFESGHLDGAVHTYVGELPKLQGSIAKGDRIVVMCGSGARATIGASLLRAAGYRDVLAEHHHVGVGSHLVIQCAARSLSHSQSLCCHVCPLSN